ncbi:MAG: LysR family transcriptional regulator, partial [Verrucomicrobia bacterium]|nr:LysR family transcriptional regulator [Verrucomicrobiota bacterium]
MEIRHLRYFLAVADQLSFTRAAGLLHVAQSAISAQIRDLEEEIGTALLERNSRKVQLTPAGKTFATGVRRVLAELEAAIKETRRAGQLEAGHLAIGFFGSQSHEWVPRVLKRFRERYTEVIVSLVEMSPAEQLEALLSRRLDVGLIGPLEGKVPAGLRAECITQEQPMVAVPISHSLAQYACIELEQLKNEDFVLTSRQSSPNYRAWLDRLCRQAGFLPKVVYEVDRARTGVQFVAAGFGISIMAEHISHFPTPGVKFIPLRSVNSKIRYGVAWRQ